MRVDLSPTLGLLNNLGASSRAASRSLSRMSSGKRLNMAKDGPSELAIANMMKAQSRGLAMANVNLDEAYDFLSIRSAAMNEVQAAVIRVRDLAVRASTDATLTDDQRDLLADEAGELVNFINRVDDSTKFFDKKVFNYSFDEVPAGSAAYNHSGKKTMSVDLKYYADQNGGVVNLYFAWYNGSALFPDANLISPDGTEAFGYFYYTWAPAGTIEQYEGGAGAQTVNQGDPDKVGLPVGTCDSVGAGGSVAYSGYAGYAGAGGWDEESFTITNPASGVWTILIDNESPTARNYGIFINEPAVDPTPNDEIFAYTDAMDEDDKFRTGQFRINSLSLGVSSALNTVSLAQTSLSSADLAIETLGKRYAQDGVVMNSIQQRIDINNATIISSEKMRSRLEDADMALELTNMTKNQIVAQSAAGLISTNLNRLQASVQQLLETV